MGFEAYANVTRRKSENIKLTMYVSESRDHIAVIILSAVLATTISTAPTLSQKVRPYVLLAILPVFPLMAILSVDTLHQQLIHC